MRNLCFLFTLFFFSLFQLSFSFILPEATCFFPFSTNKNLLQRKKINEISLKKTTLNARSILFIRGGVMGDGDSYLDRPHLHLAGKLVPTIKTSFAMLSNCGYAAREVLDAAFVEDWLIMTTFWAFCDPFFRLVNMYANRVRDKTHTRPVPFDGSFPHTLSIALRGVVKTMMGLYVFELGVVAIAALGIPIQNDLPGLAATVIFPWSIMNIGSLVKEWLLGVNSLQLEANDQKPDGKRLMYNRLADFVLGTMAAVISLDVLSVKLGVAISSILAVGGLSSIVVALACKEPLTQIVYGLLVIFNDKFRVGDSVKVGDLSGRVVEMGWFDTLIRKSDESVVIVPNGQMMTSTITNLSRQSWGQYKTELRIRYEDLDKIENVVNTIVELLKEGLEGDVILPPVRNLWAHWRSFGKDCLIVVVDMKIREMNGSSRYYLLREKANLIIANAVKKCGADFALPTSRKI